MEAARQDHGLALWAYVIMPEYVPVLLCPLEPKYEMRLIRTALKVPEGAATIGMCLSRRLCFK